VNVTPYHAIGGGTEREQRYGSAHSRPPSYMGGGKSKSCPSQLTPRKKPHYPLQSSLGGL